MRKWLLFLVLIASALVISRPHAQDVRQYYLSPYIGDGSDGNKFRPHGMEQAGAGCIDLRPNGAVATGFAICAAPVLPVQPGVISIAASSISTLDVTKRTALSAALGVTITSTTPDALLPELLITHARTDGSRWRPLRPARDGKLHIWLGQQVYQQTAWLYPYVEDGGLVADVSNAALSLIEPTLAWATSLAENWTCADNALLTCVYTWTEFTGTSWAIVTNAASSTTVNVSGEARADSDLATDDHEVSATITALTLGGTEVNVGVLARKDSTATRTFYAFGARKQSTGELNDFFLDKRIAAAITALGTNTTDFVANDVVKIRVDGDQVSGFVNTILSVGPITDTAITGFTRGGILRYASTGGAPVTTVDNWAAADYILGATRRRGF